MKMASTVDDKDNAVMSATPCYKYKTRKMKCYGGILVYNICLISISDSVSDGATNKSVPTIERS